MSHLQKELRKKALQAYNLAPLDIACQSDDPGCFRLKAMMANFEDRRVRASRRAAAGLSIARLIKRGFLECSSRGKWRLTPGGLKVARWLYPEIKPPTKRQLAHDMAFRKAIHR